MKLAILILCCAVSCFGQGHIMESIEANPPDALVVGYTFNDGAPTDWSENAVHLTVDGATFTATGGRGGSAAYTFSNTKKLWATHPTAFDNLTTLCISMSFYMNADAATKTLMSVSSRIGAAGRFMFWTYLNTNEALAWFASQDGLAWATICPSTTPYESAGVWTTAALRTISGDVGDSRIDGTVRKTDASPAASLHNSDAKLRIGAMGNYSTGDATDQPNMYFNGQLDDVLVFSRTLSVGEMAYWQEKGIAQ